LIITVVYALPDRQIVRDLKLPADATLETALRQSGLLQEFPEIDPLRTPVGIYGRVMPRDTILRPGDRVEIYRPLRVEPGTARRRRAGKR